MIFLFGVAYALMALVSYNIGEDLIDPSVDWKHLFIFWMMVFLWPAFFPFIAVVGCVKLLDKFC